MPFKSEAQRRLFHAMEARHEISPKKVKEWESETPKETKKRLPYHVADRRKSEREKKSMDQQAYEAGVKLALHDAGLLKTALPSAIPSALASGLSGIASFGGPTTLAEGGLGGAALGGVGSALLASKLLGRKAALPALLLGGLGGGLLGAGALRR